MADVIQVPFLSAEQTPAEAISLMNALNTRAACVVVGSGKFRLVRNVEILDAWRVRVPTLAGITLTEEIDPLPEIDTGPQAGSTPEGLEKLEEALDLVKADYGITDNTGVLTVFRPASVWIGTRHEGLALIIKSQRKLWRCNNPDGPHSGQIPPDACTATCKVCGWDVKCA